MQTAASKQAFCLCQHTFQTRTSFLALLTPFLSLPRLTRLLTVVFQTYFRPIYRALSSSLTLFPPRTMDSHHSTRDRHLSRPSRHKPRHFLPRPSKFTNPPQPLSRFHAPKAQNVPCQQVLEQNITGISLRICLDWLCIGCRDVSSHIVISGGTATEKR
jgi:hypothetical protein